MPRDKGINPAQAQHKKDKANAIKKSKAEKAQRMTEKLSKRNPDRVARQIETLKGLEQEGRLQGPDRKLLTDLEKQLLLINKAKDKVNAPSGSRKDGNTATSQIDKGVDRHQNKSGVYVVRGHERRSIYWDPVFNPTGLPPDGFPYQEWNDHGSEEYEVYYRPDLHEQDATGIPVPTGAALRYIREQKKIEHNKTPVESATRITYEAAPVVRDLAKESASFVPSSVLQRQQASQKRPASAEFIDSSHKMRHVELEDEYGYED
ncbi:hypothetical protein V1512DRAFT_271896 [Lipomyces arxii]|uniref:uncharacterized protein n=1 Tax=Lipomyces arxii TaxID=56418 RepID=UPI0034CF7967